jgi:hypothetical protein
MRVTHPFGIRVYAFLSEGWFEHYGGTYTYKSSTLIKKYLVTPFFVDQLIFNLTSFRHYRAFIRSISLSGLSVNQVYQFNIAV